jgi:hypothetical protein
MEGALARLTANGFLLFSDRGLAPTGRKPLCFIAASLKHAERVLDVEEDLQRFIGAFEWSPDHKPQRANVGVSFPALTRAALVGYVSTH